MRVCGNKRNDELNQESCNPAYGGRSEGEKI